MINHLNIRANFMQVTLKALQAEYMPQQRAHTRDNAQIGLTVRDNAHQARGRFATRNVITAHIADAATVFDIRIDRNGRHASFGELTDTAFQCVHH